MSFPRYPAYKPSGVEWLGEVPEHWEVKPLKRVAEIQTGLAKGKEVELEGSVEVPFLRVANVQDNFLDLENVHMITIQESSLSRYLLRPGDVLMNEGGDFDKLGRGCIWDGVINPCIHQNHVFAVRPHSIRPSWLNAYTSSKQANSYFISRSKQSTNLASISSSNLMDLPVPIAPNSETEEILGFLDRETAKIDALIVEQQRLIELLQEKRQAVISHAVTKGLNPNAPMKDSGVEWLGEVPEHWEVKKLKHLLSEPLSYGANEPAESVQLDDPRYIRITDIKDDGSLNPDTFRSLSQEKASDYLLKDKDILLARSGATVGKSFMYRSDMGPCCFAGYLILARCSPVGMTPEWIYLFSESAAYWNQIRSDAIQATIQNVSAEKYGNMLLPVPPSSEMQAVIAVARQKSDQYAQLIKAADDLIELMSERRAALISAAVTGQIDVRGLVEAEAGEQ